MRKSCASTGTHCTAPTNTACARSTSTAATASVRGVDRNRSYKRGCNHSGANVFECEHGNLLLSFLTEDGAPRRQSGRLTMCL
jgi:hypothetical protein